MSPGGVIPEIDLLEDDNGDGSTCSTVVVRVLAALSKHEGRKDGKDSELENLRHN